MESMRATWTDSRLDDFAKHTDQRFDAVDRRFDKVDERFDRVDEDLRGVQAEIGGVRVEIGGVHAEIGALHRTIIQFAAAVVAGQIGMMATILVSKI